MTNGSRFDPPSAVDFSGRFPRGFQFGAATAAYQIEGAVRADGRGPSIWDTFSATPGKIVGGDTGEHACDHYHRWAEDLDLAAGLGLDAYRFSIAWPRILPAGRGSLERRGLAFYERLIDGCLERGLAPFATLYHWDLPAALQGTGGWRRRDTAEAFADYAAAIAARFGDRLASIATINEPWCVSVLGHLEGVHAPGHRDLSETLAVAHHLLVGHGRAVAAIRAENADLPLGIVLNAQSVHPADPDDDDDRAAAERHECFHNDLWFEPLFAGRYPAPLLEALGDRLPAGFEDDLGTIAAPLDWWGLNYYKPSRVTAEASLPTSRPWPATSERAPDPARVTVTDIGWEVAPDTLTECLVRLNARWDLPPCWISENGACYNTAVEEVDGERTVADTARIEYLDAHLAAVADALEAGVDVRGYFAWSLLDNFEWAEGYAMRFGLVHVDYATQRRTPKASAHWYREAITRARLGG